jgi:hypothetical protein
MYTTAALVSVYSAALALSARPRMKRSTTIKKEQSQTEINTDQAEFQCRDKHKKLD